MQKKLYQCQHYEISRIDKHKIGKYKRGKDGTEE